MTVRRQQASVAQHESQARGLDLDTITYGTEGPFLPWEADHTALVHVLWCARHRGLDTDRDAEAIAAMIERSRFLAAHRHFGRPQPRVLGSDEQLPDLIRRVGAQEAAPLSGEGADRLATAILGSPWMRDALHGAPA